MKVTTASTYHAFEIPTLPGEETHAAGLGTFAGATVTLETFVDGEWHAVPDGEFEEPFEIVRVNGPGTHLRLSVSDVGAETDLSVTLTSLPR